MMGQTFHWRRIHFVVVQIVTIALSARAVKKRPTIENEIDTLHLPLTEVYFPSVVICNTISQYQTCSDLTLMAIWQGTVTFNFDIPREFETDLGTCCWYTPQHNYTEIREQTQEGEDLDWGLWLANVPKGVLVGQDNGFEMLVDLMRHSDRQSPVINEGLRIKPKGLMVALVHHLDQPIMRHSGLLMAPGTTNLVKVEDVVITSITEDAKERFTPLERDCFSEGEVSLKHLPDFYGYRYSVSNCWFEYVLQEVESVCRCQHWEYQIPPEKRGETGLLPICNRNSTRDISCVEKQFARGQTEIYKRARMANCLPSCEDQKLGSVSVTSSPIAPLLIPDIYCLLTKKLTTQCKIRSCSDSSDFCKFLDMMCLRLQDLEIDGDINCKSDENKRKLNEFKSYLDTYALTNLVHFNIYFKDHFATRYIKRSKLTMVQKEL